MSQVEQLLSEHPYFRDLDVQYLTLLAGLAKEVRYDRDAYLFREGKEATLFYIILEGRVALEILTPNRGPLVIQTVGDGELLGWSWAVPPYRKRFDARAVEPTHAIALDAVRLRDECEKDCRLGYELFKRTLAVMSQRLQATRMQLLDMYDVPA